MVNRKSPLEDTVEDYLVKRVKALGGIALKGDIKGQRFLDRIVILPSGVTVWCECKRPDGTGRYSKHQDETLKRLGEMGHAIVRIASKPDVDRFVERFDTRVATGAYPSPSPQMTGEPDYCFNPDNWEFTCHWSDRDEVHGHGDALNRSEPMRVATLTKGPDKWVADVPVTWDEHGDPDETEVKWFDSEEEARAALTTEGQP